MTGIPVAMTLRTDAYTEGDKERGLRLRDITGQSRSPLEALPPGFLYMNEKLDLCTDALGFG